MNFNSRVHALVIVQALAHAQVVVLALAHAHVALPALFPFLTLRLIFLKPTLLTWPPFPSKLSADLLALCAPP